MVDPVTDSPPNPSRPKLTKSESVKAFIGDLARPFNQYAVGSATAIAIVIGATKITDAYAGAAYILAVGSILATIFGLKTLENVKVGGQQRDVAVATVNSATGAAS